MGAECPHLEDGIVGGVRDGGEERGGGGGLITDERVDGGVKEVDKGWEVTLDGNDWGELGRIKGNELKEGIKDLVLEVDGADLEAGEEVTDEEGEVGMAKREAKEVEDDGIDVGEVVEKAGAEEEVEVMK